MFTGSDGLSDGLYADFGADHITRPGYERLLEYAAEFDIPLVPYPNAEGAWLPYNDHVLRLIDGKRYTNSMLADPATLARLGFNRREARFLSQHPWYELEGWYLRAYVERIADPRHPFGVGPGCARQRAHHRYLQARRRFAGGDPSSRRSAHQRALPHMEAGCHADQRASLRPQGEMFRLQGGNEQLPVAFARRLGARVKLAHPIMAIRQAARRHRELSPIRL